MVNVLNSTLVLKTKSKILSAFFYSMKRLKFSISVISFENAESMTTHLLRACGMRKMLSKLTSKWKRRKFSAIRRLIRNLHKSFEPCTLIQLLLSTNSDLEGFRGYGFENIEWQIFPESSCTCTFVVYFYSRSTGINMLALQYAKIKS